MKGDEGLEGGSSSPRNQQHRRTGPHPKAIIMSQMGDAQEETLICQ